VIEDSLIGAEVTIGPSAHLRPGNTLGEGVKIGNFVELKNSILGSGTKAAHLGYIGDADVGEGVNFSCGAIVVNYDGFQKTRSKIGDGAFIGCNANLVSPIEIANNAFVAAGSTITKDVPEGALAVARERQRNIEGWVSRRQGRASTQSGTKSGSGVSATGQAGPKTEENASAKKKPTRQKSDKKQVARKADSKRSRS
jgi:bifunctional UDP-N-acetylglucosamine pyrophosphorylase/glucosamine-1-phosphate N-acetyltransferase